MIATGSKIIPIRAKSLGTLQMSETWTYLPLDDAAEAASHVIEELAKRGWTIGT